MMGAVSDARFDSFAQNGEDVVLWRALRDVEHGRYVDVGANDPTNDSVSRAFYDQGWRGIAIEPVPAYAQRFREQRPGDHVIEAAITAHSDDVVTLYEVPGTGLSTLLDTFRNQHRRAGHETREIKVITRTLDDVLADAGWDDTDIHFVSIDTEGSEAGVLRGFDLLRWHPWVLVIEATAPDSERPTYGEWESLVTSAGYRFCLFDGLSRFYVAADHTDLVDRLSHGAAILDRYTTLRQRELEADTDKLRKQLDKTSRALQDATTSLDQATYDVLRWRSAALMRWAESIAAAASDAPLEADHLRSELVAMRQTVSWRVTRPLRAVRERMKPVQTGRR